MDIRYDSASRVVTAYMPQKLVYENVESVGREIMAFWEGVPGGGKGFLLQLDLSHLQMISSAGIRKLMELYQLIKAPVTLINVQPDVFEQLSLTELNRLFYMLPPVINLSVSAYSKIGEGRNGAIYRIGPDMVCKVYRQGETLQALLREKEICTTVLKLGLPTVICYQIVMVQGRYGVVYELIPLNTLSDVLREEPDREEEVLDRFVAFLDTIHQTPAPMLKDLKAEYKKKVLDRLERVLDPASFAILRQVFDQVPEGDGFVHGDPHFANVFWFKEELLMVDLDGAGHGDGIWDLVSLYSTFVGFRLLDECDVVRLGKVDNYIHFWKKIFERWIISNGLDLEHTKKVVSILSLARVLEYALRHDSEEENYVELAQICLAYWLGKWNE